MNGRVAALVVFTLLPCCSGELDLPTVNPQQSSELKEYIKTHYMTPEDYVLSKFKDHDVVFLGEYHRIKHDVELIHRLIPRLYEHGVFYLGTEFARREDQQLIDILLDSPNYDEHLAQEITFNQLVHWGYQEYVDIYKVAWELNHGLPEGSREFRILALNDSPDWSLVKTAGDKEDAAIKQQVWQGGGEHLWAKTILDEVVAEGEKALIYSGLHHAFTEYNQPVFDEKQSKFIRFEKSRMGNFVFSAIGKKAITLCLHAPWPSSQGYSKPYVYPVDGVIDALMAEIPLDSKRVGFDIKVTPFGQLEAETSIYKHGYDTFSLERLCDGYIYQMPLSEYDGVTPIDGFVNENNIDQARGQSPNPGFRNATISDFFQSTERCGHSAPIFSLSLGGWPHRIS